MHGRPPSIRPPSGAFPAVGSGPTFAPGTSPFHVKGHVYRSSLEYYAAHVDGGADAVLALMDAPHAEFFRQPFVVGGWYDALPLVALGLAASRARGLTLSDSLRQRASAQATQDVHGIYRMLLRLTSPETVVTRIGRVMLQYFDFGTSESRMIGVRTAEIVQSGVPVHVVPLSGPIAEGFVTRVLELARADNVRFRTIRPTSEGSARGVECFRLRFEVSWGE